MRMQRYGHHNFPRRRAVRAGCLMLLSTLAAAPAAGAATRYADPAATDTTGFCTQAAPCRVDHAVGGALLGDTVVLAPGTYSVTYQVRSALPITIRGTAGQPRPLLSGASGLGSPTLELAAAGTVSGIDVETNSEVALQLSAGAKAEGVRAAANSSSATAVAVRMVSAPTPTTLLNSVAHSDSDNTAVDVVDPIVPGAAKILNVTAVSTGTGSWGITTDMALQPAVVKNTVARAPGKDLHAVSGSTSMAVSYSNFRPAGSDGFTSGPGNQSADPAFVDQAEGDYSLTSGSPLIDAGAADSLLSGLTAVLGGTRILGAAPDIGAFEFNSPPPDDPGPGQPDAGSTGSDLNKVTSDAASGLAAALPPLAPPVMAQTVALRRSSGSPRVRLPGSDTYLPLTAGAAIPVGATIDATRGTVSLSSVRDASGKTQTGQFWGGVFQVNQTRGKAPMTELVLQGGDFTRCPKAKRAGKAGAAARSRHAAKMRRLWGRDKKGRFRTKGRNAHATVRGTIWLVEDRCDGTLTKVKEGAVMVRDLRKRKNVLVRAGKSYLARSR